MERIIVSLAIILLLATSCQKSTISRGLYYADTPDGLLYLQLMENDDCEMFFEGGEHSDGGYFISNGEINLIAHAKSTKKINGVNVSWWFGGTLGKGTIYSNYFTIKGQRLYSSNPEYRSLIFYKH